MHKALFALLLLVISVTITACHPSKFGFAPPPPPEITSKALDPLLLEGGEKSAGWLKTYEDNLKNCYPTDAPPVGGKCGDQTWEDNAKARRNAYIEAIRAKIDDGYTNFSENLHAKNSLLGMTSDFAILGLGGAGSVIGDAELKSILASTSAGVSGANSSFQKQVMNQQSVLAVISAMDAARANAEAVIAADESTDIYKCSIQCALIDLRRYYAAGTLTQGLIYIQGTMQTQKQTTQKAAKTLQLK